MNKQWVQWARVPEYKVNSFKTLAFRFLWRSSHWCNSFLVWKFSDYETSKTKAKAHCWRSNCRISFVIYYLGIRFTYIKRIEKYSQLKTKLPSSFTLIRKFHLIRQFDSSHILITLIYYNWVWNLHFIFLSIYPSVNIFYNFKVLVVRKQKEGFVNHFVGDKVLLACQSWTPGFVCSFGIRDCMCLRFSFMVPIPWMSLIDAIDITILPCLWDW